MKVHLHAEQFDGALHTTCGRADDRTAHIVHDEEFESTPHAARCAYCEASYWPHGGWTDRAAWA